MEEQALPVAKPVSSFCLHARMPQRVAVQHPAQTLAVLMMLRLHQWRVPASQSFAQPLLKRFWLLPQRRARVRVQLQWH